MKRIAGCTFLALCAVGILPAQTAATQRAQRPRGYLTSQQISEVERVVPPAPVTGDARFEADMKIFHETRKLEASPRWAMAQSDDNLSIQALLKTFSCAMKVQLTPENAPKLAALIERATADAYAGANILKNNYKHKRPFQLAEGNVCVTPQGKAALERSPDYPSGHTTASWEIGLILADVSPAEAPEVLARARAFGQSRVVCGVHNLSAVEAGWMTADTIFALQRAESAFNADLAAARAEVAALRKEKAPEPSGCAAERETLSKNPY